MIWCSESRQKISNWSYGNYPMQIVGGGTGSVPQTKQARATAGRCDLCAVCRWICKRRDVWEQGGPSVAPLMIWRSILQGCQGKPERSELRRFRKQIEPRAWRYGHGARLVSGRRKDRPGRPQNGPMYTQDKEEAAGYLAGFERRTGRQAICENMPFQQIDSSTQTRHTRQGLRMTLPS